MARVLVSHRRRFYRFQVRQQQSPGLRLCLECSAFQAGEGYTSFLWVVLLDVVWRISGVEPPDSANYLALSFTYLTLLIGALMVLKMSLRAELHKYRVLFVGLVLAGVITNRTFLAWTSSGL